MSNALTIRKDGELDFLSLGALVHRLDPGIIPFRKATECALARIIDGIKRSLPTFRIEILAEVSLTVEQSHSHHRNPEIARCLHLIAGHIAKAARVDRQCFAQHELHAEVGGQRERGIRMFLLKPCVRAIRLSIPLQQFFETLTKSRLRQRSYDRLSGHSLQDDPWILCGLP